MRPAGAVALTALLALGVAGCGGDSKSAAQKERDYCAAARRLDKAEPDIDFEHTTPAQQKQAFKRFFAELRGDVRVTLENAPDDLRDDVRVLADAVDRGARTGDVSAFQTKAVDRAGSRTDAYARKACGIDAGDDPAGPPTSKPTSTTSISTSMPVKP